MFKKVFILIFLSVFVISCWEEESAVGLSEIIWNGYTMDIPSTWEIVEDIEEILPNANVWNIELAVSSTNFISGFANNLLILSDDLNRITTSKEYSMLNNIWAEKDYLNYTELSSQEITFADWEEWMIYEFEAKYNMDTPVLKFLQTAYICHWTKAYFMTIALPKVIEDTSKYKYLLSTFTCN